MLKNETRRHTRTLLTELIDVRPPVEAGAVEGDLLEELAGRVEEHHRVLHRLAVELQGLPAAAAAESPLECQFAYKYN